jgi:hypothetical protein
MWKSEELLCLTLLPQFFMVEQEKTLLSEIWRIWGKSQLCDSEKA